MKNALYVLLGVIAGFILAGGARLCFACACGESDRAGRRAHGGTDCRACDRRGGASGGSYEFPTGRIEDAIDASGGLLAEADPESLNLAQLLEDGPAIGHSI